MSRVSQDTKVHALRLHGGLTLPECRAILFDIADKHPTQLIRMVDRLRARGPLPPPIPSIPGDQEDSPAVNTGPPSIEEAQKLADAIGQAPVVVAETPFDQSETDAILKLADE